MPTHVCWDLWNCSKCNESTWIRSLTNMCPWLHGSIFSTFACRHEKVTRLVSLAEMRGSRWLWRGYPDATKILFLFWKRSKPRSILRKRCTEWSYDKRKKIREQVQLHSYCDLVCWAPCSEVPIVASQNSLQKCCFSVSRARKSLRRAFQCKQVTPPGRKQCTYNVVRIFNPLQNTNKTITALSARKWKSQ